MKKILLLFMVCICCILSLPITSYAKDGIGDIEDFKNLEGDSKYIKDEYRDNYSLDIQETGILDYGSKLINDIANILFYIIRMLAYVVCAIFYFALDFDVSKLMSNEIDTIQSALHDSIFVPLFGLAFCGTSFMVIKRFLKRDLIGSINDLLKVVGVVILASLVVTNSSTALSSCTSITKSASLEILTGINGTESSDTATFGANTSGILWNNLIHRPWKTLEFGKDNPDEADVENFLSTDSNSEARAKLVKDYSDSDTVFNIDKGCERIGFIIVYFIPFTVKCIIFLAIALFQLAFQLLAVFYLLLAPIVLVLALIPNYEYGILSNWFRKMLETQISILVLTFLMGMLIYIDKAIYGLSDTYGWLVVAIIQTIIYVILFLYRDKILHSLSAMQKGMQNPAYANRALQKSGNVYANLERMRHTRFNKSHQGSNIFPGKPHIPVERPKNNSNDPNSNVVRPTAMKKDNVPKEELLKNVSKDNNKIPNSEVKRPIAMKQDKVSKNLKNTSKDNKRPDTKVKRPTAIKTATKDLHSPYDNNSSAYSYDWRQTWDASKSVKQKDKKETNKDHIKKQSVKRPIAFQNNQNISESNSKPILATKSSRATNTSRNNLKALKTHSVASKDRTSVKKPNVILYPNNLKNIKRNNLQLAKQVPRIKKAVDSIPLEKKIAIASKLI